MKGIECPICHGRCDPGEMIGGVCLECREEERQRIALNGLEKVQRDFTFENALKRILS